MHIRPKPWARPELDAADFFINEPEALKGHWGAHFPKKQPLHIELGCGKGTFLSTLASRNPQNNYIGVDLIDAVLGLSKRAIESAYGDRPIDNCRLLAKDITRIDEILSAEDAIERIYINFCNPWPKRRFHKKRLTHPRQLQKYRTFLTPEGEIHFKTDNDDLFEASLGYFETEGFTLATVVRDLHAWHKTDNIVTEHERLFSEQGIPIKYAVARKA